MRKPSRFNLLAALLVIVLTAGAAFADGSETPPPDPGSTCEVDGVQVTEEDVVVTDEGDEGETGEEGQEEGDQGEDECVEEEEPVEESSVDEGSVPPVDPDRQVACETAAGLVPGSGPGDEGVKLTGLDNAIAKVLANCLKNEKAPGLLNALRHLVANRDRHEAHEAEKALRAAERAERKAAHDAWKAAKKAAHEAGGHGNGHGQGHGQGS
jgi:hypothetical protein